MQHKQLWHKAELYIIGLPEMTMYQTVLFLRME